MYTISSDLGSVGARQTMATGSVQFTGSARSDIRDIVVASRDLQPFPGELAPYLNHWNVGGVSRKRARLPLYGETR